MATKKVVNVKMSCRERLIAVAAALSLAKTKTTEVAGRKYQGQGRKVQVFEHLPQADRLKVAEKVAAAVTGKGKRAVAASDGSYTIHYDAHGNKGAKVLLQAGVITGQAAPRIIAACVDAVKAKAAKVASPALPAVSAAKKAQAIEAAKAPAKTKNAAKAPAKTKTTATPPAPAKKAPRVPKK